MHQRLRTSPENGEIGRMQLIPPPPPLLYRHTNGLHGNQTSFGKGAFWALSSVGIISRLIISGLNCCSGESAARPKHLNGVSLCTNLSGLYALLMPRVV